MSVRIEGQVAHLVGDVEVEDAEILARACENGEVTRADLSQCRHLHGAVVQALLSFAINVQGAPEEEFLTRFVFPALTGNDRAPGPAPQGPEHGTPE